VHVVLSCLPLHEPKGGVFETTTGAASSTEQSAQLSVVGHSARGRSSVGLRQVACCRGCTVSRVPAQWILTYMSGSGGALPNAGCAHDL